MKNQMWLDCLFRLVVSPHPDTGSLQLSLLGNPGRPDWSRYLVLESVDLLNYLVFRLVVWQHFWVCLFYLIESFVVWPFCLHLDIFYCQVVTEGTSLVHSHCLDHCHLWFGLCSLHFFSF